MSSGQARDPLQLRGGKSDLGRMELGKKGSMDGQDWQIKVRMRREGHARETGALLPVCD